MRLTFEDWMNRVNDALSELCGATYEDIPDWNWHGAYEDRINPRIAAKRALKNAWGA